MHTFRGGVRYRIMLIWLYVPLPYFPRLPFFPLLFTNNYRPHLHLVSLLHRLFFSFTHIPSSPADRRM